MLPIFDPLYQYDGLPVPFTRILDALQSAKSGICVLHDPKKGGRQGRQSFTLYKTELYKLSSHSKFFPESV